MPEIPNSARVAPGASDFGVGGKVSLKYTVFSNDRTQDDAFAVLGYSSVPRIGSRYLFGSTIRNDYIAKSAKPSPGKLFGNKGRVWEIEVFYDNAHSTAEQPEPSETDPCTVSMRTERIKQVMTHDINGVRICNSAGEPFDTPIEWEFLIPVFTIQRSEYTNPMQRVIGHTERVNDLPFWGMDIGQVCVLSVIPSTEFRYGDQSLVWRVTYDIGVNLAGTGWQLEMLDCGKKQISSKTIQNGKPMVNLEAILDANGHEVDKPQLLDGAGKLLATGAEPAYLHFEKRYMANHNVLSLPNPFIM